MATSSKKTPAAAAKQSPQTNAAAIARKNAALTKSKVSPQRKKGK